MTLVRDMIPAFDLFQPTSVEDALDRLAEYGNEGWALAGGLDSFDWFKDRIKRPRAVVDLGGLDELKGVREADGGLDIGALTPLSEVERHPLVTSRFELLARAVSQVATPQIRNQGTLGGNLCQDTRCWYYRSGWPCYRAGGNTCYAAAPRSMNREHCVLGASRCVAVNPSDAAPALVALGASMTVHHRGGVRRIEAEDFFVGPAIDITRMTVLGPADLLASIRVPGDWANARTYFEKVRERRSWDFSLATVAAAFRMDGARIADARIAVNGVAPVPLRVREAERVVKGHAADEEVAQAAGEAAIVGARALRHNDYKIPLVRNLVRRAVRSVAP